MKSIFFDIGRGLFVLLEVLELGVVENGLGLHLLKLLLLAHDVVGIHLKDHRVLLLS